MSDRRRFVGNAIGCEVLDGTLIAGIGNQEAGVYVMFQRSASDNNEEVWFEFDDQINGDCNQVQTCRILDDRMTIDLRFPVGGVSGFDIRLECEPEEGSSLREQLAAIFSNAPGILETD